MKMLILLLIFTMTNIFIDLIILGLFIVILFIIWKAITTD